MNLRWTDAGRAALASATHVGTAAVRLTHLAIGDGSGPGGDGDDGRTDLRNERHRAAIAGTPAAFGRIALRADFSPDASYSITEAGIFGTAGDPPGASQLLLYWTDGGSAAGAAASGTTLAIAAVIEFQNAAAEVAVTVGGNIVFGATDPATESDFGSTRYATAAETGAGTSGDRSVTPKGLHSAAGKVVAALLAGAPGDGTIYQLKGTASGALVAEERTQDGASAAGIAANAALITGIDTRVVAVEGKTMAATTARKGIVELATSTEAEAGTDAARAMTPKAARDSIAASIASLKDSAPEAGEKLILEGVAGGGVKVVRAPFELAGSTVTLRQRALSRLEYNEEVDSDEEVVYGYEREVVGARPSIQLGPGVWVVAAWASDAFPTAGATPGNLSGSAGWSVTTSPGFEYEAVATGGGQLPIGYDPAAEWDVGVVRADIAPGTTREQQLEVALSSADPAGADVIGPWAETEVELAILASKIKEL